MNKILFFIITLILSAPLVHAKEFPMYDFKDIGIEMWFRDSEHAFYLNNNGNVAGQLTDKTAFFWDEGSGITKINQSFLIRGLNNKGDVLGYNNKYIFIWNKASGMKKILDYVPGYGFYPSSINDSCVVAREYSPLGGEDFKPVCAATWSQDKGVTEFRSMGGTSDARCINNRGSIAGMYSLDKYGRVANRAAIWDEPDGMREIGSLSQSEIQFTIVYDINELNEVVGSTPVDGRSPRHAFIWNVNEGIKDIHLLGVNSIAKSINSSSVVVGEYSSSDYNNFAFIWDSKEGMRKLQDLIPYEEGLNLMWADGINDSGQIVGGFTRDGHTRIYEDGEEMPILYGFLLTPKVIIPEPVSIFLFGLGGAVIVFIKIWK